MIAAGKALKKNKGQNTGTSIVGRASLMTSLACSQRFAYRFAGHSTVFSTLYIIQEARLTYHGSSRIYMKLSRIVAHRWFTFLKNFKLLE